MANSAPLSWTWRIEPLRDRYVWNGWLRLASAFAVVMAAVAGTIIMALAGWRVVLALEVYVAIAAGSALAAIGFCAATALLAGNAISVRFTVDERGAARTVDAGSANGVASAGDAMSALIGDGPRTTAGMADLVLPTDAAVTWADVDASWDEADRRVVVRRRLRAPLPIYVPTQFVPAVGALMARAGCVLARATRRRSGARPS